MLVKEKEFFEPDNRLIRAGDEAEKQMAFYLRRRFGEREDIFLLNDLRLLHQNEPFQIDHLVITRFGLFVIESKSVHGVIRIVQHEGGREHWSRLFEGTQKGIESPVRQVDEQARLLKALIRINADKVLGKLFGLRQKGFRFCPIEPYVAISTSAVFELGSETSLPAAVFKADEISPVIDEKFKKWAWVNSPLRMLDPRSITDDLWSMTRDEAEQLARFLAVSHTPRSREQVTVANQAPISGAKCPKCGINFLAQATRKVSDGTSELVLACLGNKNKSCDWIQTRRDNQVVIPAIDLQSPVAKTTLATNRERMTEYYCYSCRISITPAEAKYCWNKSDKFGGRAYCRICQKKESSPKH